ncbi:glycine-rich protein DOT1-like [Rhododendron vialii]|uniref:glycine-rich protein DOT1-like n=1 Tax=Rhododendron vialii TaxID=182163 RepID=UPI00265D79D0|nr:glycine-rich protein DOT1-like [Rhododendron vialii]
MAEPGGGGGNGGDRGGGDEVRQRGEPESPQIDDQTLGEAPSAISAEASGGLSGGDGHAAEVGGGDEGHTPGGIRRTPGSVVMVGPLVRRLDPSSGVEGVVITSLGSAGAGGSGSGSGDDGDRPETPVRDPARGKGPVVEEGASGEVPVGEVEFRSAVGSSAHVPITQGDFAEFVSEEELGRLLRENPGVVAAVLAAREDRARGGQPALGATEVQQARLSSVGL